MSDFLIQTSIVLALVFDDSLPRNLIHACFRVFSGLGELGNFARHVLEHVLPLFFQVGWKKNGVLINGIRGWVWRNATIRKMYKQSESIDIN